MTHADKAEALFTEGFNCAQAVACAFCEDAGVDRETLLRLSSSFGGGLARMRELCGAVSGMAMAAGLLRGYSDPADPSAKAAHYALVRGMAERFRTEAGSIVCRELLGGAAPGGKPSARTAEFYEKRPCVRVVRLAAQIAEEALLPVAAVMGDAPCAGESSGQ